MSNKNVIYTKHHRVEVKHEYVGNTEALGYYVYVWDIHGHGGYESKLVSRRGPFATRDEAQYAARTSARNYESRGQEPRMRRYGRSNPSKSKTPTSTYVLAGMGVALVAGIGYYLYSQQQASASATAGGGTAGGGGGSAGGGGTSSQGSNVMTLGSGGSSSALPASSGTSDGGSDIDWTAVGNQAIDAGGSIVPFAQPAT
jgi:hypothetical protein